jgi:hypothetical protein
VQGFRVFSSYLFTSLEEKTPMARLRASGMMYLRFGLENPRDYRMIFMSAPEDLAGLEKGGIDTSATFRFLVDRVAECIKSRDLAKPANGDATEVAAIIWAHVHGLVSLRVVGRFAKIGDDAAFARFFRHSTDRMLRGLAP